ncbi:outer membrane transport energization protein TonB [Lutibacter maritimus]|uniref:Outer membrane transport energization protein TonB n=2 Tax=Lutibacter maritimus TaxID=593133 RepID=A0A1I6S996_9FLAO|nr:outer membrane transport energization protein TonB [Lutibacter maritimus]
MNFLDTKYKRQSAAITSVLMSLLLVAILFVGMTYLDPPEEYGIAVNFGTSDVGMGDKQPTELLKSAPQEISERKEQIVEEQVTETTSNKNEEVLTQNTEDAIAIKKQIEAKKRADEIAKLEKIKQDAIAKQKAEEDAKRKKLDALIGGVSNSKGTATGGEGDDNTAGDKGKITGDPNANGYYGNGGNGGGGDYQLGNRKPITRPKPDYICDEEGVVVVSIEVDTNGNVIKATPGVKGSTNTAACLMSQAKEAALKTKWSSDSKAPSKQVGTIKYRFSLSQ